MDSKSEQWKILDNFPGPDNYMFQCLELKLRASGKRQIMCGSWSRRERKLHLNVIKLKTTKWEKKVPSLIAHPLKEGGGSGKGGMWYVRIGKKMIFIIVLLFGNNLQYKFNIWKQGVFVRTAPSTLPHTHIHPHTHIFYIYYQLTTEIKITFLFIILWWFLISPWLFSLCPYGQWEGGSVDVDRCWQEEEGSKITGNVWIFFMDDF